MCTQTTFSSPTFPVVLHPGPPTPLRVIVHGKRVRAVILQNVTGWKMWVTDVRRFCLLFVFFGTWAAHATGRGRRGGDAVSHVVQGFDKQFGTSQIGNQTDPEINSGTTNLVPVTDVLLTKRIRDVDDQINFARLNVIHRVTDVGRQGGGGGRRPRFGFTGFVQDGDVLNVAFLLQHFGGATRGK